MMMCLRSRLKWYQPLHSTLTSWVKMRQSIQFNSILFSETKYSASEFHNECQRLPTEWVSFGPVMLTRTEPPRTRTRTRTWSRRWRLISVPSDNNSYISDSFRLLFVRHFLQSSGASCNSKLDRGHCFGPTWSLTSYPLWLKCIKIEHLKIET